MTVRFNNELDNNARKRAIRAGGANGMAARNARFSAAKYNEAEILEQRKDRAFEGFKKWAQSG